MRYFSKRWVTFKSDLFHAEPIFVRFFETKCCSPLYAPQDTTKRPTHYANFPFYNLTKILGDFCPSFNSRQDLHASGFQLEPWSYHWYTTSAKKLLLSPQHLSDQPGQVLQRSGVCFILFITLFFCPDACYLFRVGVATISALEDAYFSTVGCKLSATCDCVSL